MLRKSLAALVILLVGFVASAQTAAGVGRDVRLVETYTQYVPYAMDLGLEYLGQPTGSTLLDRSIELGIATIIEVAVVNGVLKKTVKEVRPDGSDTNSFPSGHTCTAFIGAELIRVNYGWGPAVGAYALAATTGALRVEHQRHYWWDAATGALIGIACADLAHLLLGPVKDVFGIKPRQDFALCPSIDPLSGTVCASFNYRF